MNLKSHLIGLPLPSFLCSSTASPQQLCPLLPSLSLSDVCFRYVIWQGTSPSAKNILRESGRRGARWRGWGCVCALEKKILFFSFCFKKNIHTYRGPFLKTPLSSVHDHFTFEDFCTASDCGGSCRAAPIRRPCVRGAAVCVGSAS